MWTVVVLCMLSAVFDISMPCVVVLIIPHAHFCVTECFSNFPQVGEENVEVHADVNQGSCAVDGRGSVDASASVAVDYADPSVAQGSHDAVPTSRHEDSDVCIEKPLENVGPATSVVASPV